MKISILDAAQQDLVNGYRFYEAGSTRYSEIIV